MLTTSLDVSADELARRTGWSIEPRGACKGDRCVPLPHTAVTGGRVDVAAFAAALNMPLMHDAAHQVWSMGPEAGRALTTAVAPDLVLPDLDGNEFALSSLKGRKVILTAWASW